MFEKVSGLSGSRLSRVLSGSCLSGSCLSGSCLSGSGLSGSRLSGSRLSSTLSGSRMSGSRMSGSRMSDSRLSSTRSSTLSGFRLSSTLSSTRLPDSRLQSFPGSSGRCELWKTSNRQLSTGTSQNASPKRARPYTWLILLGVFSFLGFTAFKYYTRHNFPPSVAAKLRKGLRAEREATESKETNKKDYKVALEYYLEALEEADNTGMDNISDEYTGLQIKIAEMYEKLGMDEEARLLYREIGTFYIQALASGKVASSLRPHIIQRDLRIALKSAMYETAINPGVAKMGLLVHFRMAQDEIASRDEELAKLINGEKTKTSLDLNLVTDPTSPEMKKHTKAWEPFRDELISCRDMFVALCLASGDLGLALQTKLATTEWMTLAGSNIGDILMSFYNVGSIFYLQSEELELQQMHFEKTNDEKKTADSKKLASDSIANSSACFKVILDVVEKLPGRVRREPSVTEVHALSTYGLGVIALHKGEYEKASDFLREARLRAKGCGFQDLVTSSELELEKLDKFEKELESGTEHMKYDPPSMDVLLLKGEKDDNTKKESSSS